MLISNCSRKRESRKGHNCTFMDNKKDTTIKDEKEKPKEIGGFKGQEPTTHGDWQHKGRHTKATLLIDV